MLNKAIFVVVAGTKVIVILGETLFGLALLMQNSSKKRSL